MSLSCIIANAQDRFANVEIKTTKLTPQAFMLEGSGGNIMILVDDQQLLMVDSQYAPLSEKIKAAIREMSDLPISYLVNTHHHGDHSGGNANFNSDITTIVAQVNAKKRIENENKDGKAIPEETLDEEMTIALDAQNIMLIHVHNAHTDGDTFVYAVDQNILHMGDVYFNGKYPYIDLKSGGSISGYLEAHQTALNMINEETIIIPGHGGVSNYEQFREYSIELSKITERIESQIALKRTKEEIINDDSITEATDNVGYGDGFINAKKFRETVYDSLTAK